MMAGEGKPAVEVVLTVLHAGRQVRRWRATPCPAACTASASRWSTPCPSGSRSRSAATASSGPRRTPRGPDGAARTWPRRPTRPAPQITFWADDAIFETVDYDFETLSRRFQEMAFLNKGLTLSLTDERPDARGRRRTASAPSATSYAGGIVDFVKHLNAKKGEAHRSIIDFESEDVDARLSLEVAMQWNTGFSESVYTFANTINTHEGGTHEEGFRSALTTLVNKYAASGAAEGEGAEPLRRGRAARASPRSSPSSCGEPQFEGQTKTKLGNTEAKAFVQKVVQRPARRLVRGEPRARASEIISQGRRSRRECARMAARKARDLTAARLLESGGLPGKLADCQSRTRRSASCTSSRATRPAAPPSSGRDRFQAILPHPRQDPQRREGAHRQGAAEHRGAGADHGHRHRGPRRVRPGEGSVPQDRADGRRRRGRRSTSAPCCSPCSSGSCGR
jgi:DNA gyrase subunit B